MDTKTYNVHCKAVKEKANTDLNITVTPPSGEKSSFTKRLKQDLREMLTLKAGNAMLGYRKLGWNSSKEAGEATEIPYNLILDPSVTDLYMAFSYLKSVKEIDISEWNSPNVIGMGSMLRNCENLEILDMSSFDTANVEKFSGMFYNCAKLREIKGVFDLSSINEDNASHNAVTGMFENCPSDLRVTFKNAPKDFLSKKIQPVMGGDPQTIPELMGLTPEQCTVLSYKGE